MALTVVTSGTTAGLVIGVETNLESARAPGAATTYIYAVDMGAMTSTTPDVTFFRVYTVLLASGTERLAYFGSFIAGMDIDFMQYSVPIPVDTGTGITIRASLQQKAGTGRAYPWKLYSL